MSISIILYKTLNMVIIYGGEMIETKPTMEEILEPI